MIMTATYSPEDNKLRLYASSRLDDETYKRVKSAGFKWAPKQELFVAPSWTPAREDLLLELCGEIEDEDYSPEERSADRAERFSGYLDKRRSEAHGHADTFESGPSTFGHQNHARAERQAARHDRYRANAVSQWSKAEYWQQRTAGVISQALHRSSAKVRRGRILRLEAEQRQIVSRYTPRDDNRVMCEDDDGNICEHAYCGAGRGGWWVPVSRLEAIKNGYAREVAHLELRLSYERAMLEAEGGAAFNDTIEEGYVTKGGKCQVTKVNRSGADKRVVLGLRGQHGNLGRVPTHQHRTHEFWSILATERSPSQGVQGLEPCPESQDESGKRWQAEAHQPHPGRCGQAARVGVQRPTPE
jgi:hypothetical protein